MDPHNIGSFQESLIGLLGEHVQVKDHIALETTFDSKASDITIEVKHLVVETTPHTKTS